jgi:hypothetical protein
LQRRCGILSEKRFEEIFGRKTLMGKESVCCGLSVGDDVPDFEMDAYLPTEDDFGKVSLKKLKKEGRWTILFFYPADFTFV